MKPQMAPIKGLYAVTPDLADTTLLLRKVGAALAGGARLLQYRNKTAHTALRLERASALSTLCQRYAAALIINDHVSLAPATGAAGVHVGREDAAAAKARAELGPGKIIGVSCYDDMARATAAVGEGADYIAFGSFFASPTKPGATRAPLALLAQARQQFKVPVIAIGGIDLENAATVISAGADAVAVISALFDARDITATAREFCNLFTT